MSEARINNAVDRIEKALARVETQVALARHSGGDDSALLAKHDALRASVASRTSIIEARWMTCGSCPSAQATV